MDDEGAHRAAVTAHRLQSEMDDRAQHMSLVLRRTARALERSAGLAEDHAKRRERSGDDPGAATERQMARRAGDAARRARAQAADVIRSE